MRKFCAFLCIACLLSSYAAPASAGRVRREKQVSSVEVVTSVSDSCELEPTFADLKEHLETLSETALHAGLVASHLHHTSRSRPYKQVEDDWFKILDLSNATLDTLSNIPIALDASPDTPQKKTALALTKSYQQAVTDLVEYGHRSVDYERSENWLSMNIVQGKVGFGVYWLPTTTAGNNIISRRFAAVNAKAHDAILSVLLPERRYARSCRRSPAPEAPSQGETLADPCELSGQLIAIHEGIRQIKEQADDAGNRTARLHATSLSRPYKHIEQDWSEVSSAARTLSTTLTAIALEIDDAPDTNKKLAAQDLIHTDNAAISRITSYAQASVGFERAENFLSLNTQREYLTFGVSKQAGKTSPDNVAHQEFNQKFEETDNAEYSLEIPEAHYAKLCDVTF